MVITPGKNFPGQKGFPTPSDIPSDTACRSFILPDNDEWFGLLMGAVELLLNPHNYFNYGALSIDDTVDNWQLIIQDAYERSLLGTCDPTVPAPYWDEDSADDTAIEMPVETQIWYGEIVEISAFIAEDTPSLTFLDNVGIFAIAGFIAYAGLPGAAIAFVPIAKRFVLAFKQNSLGGVVKALIDFAEVAEIDTYGIEDKVQNLNIIMPDDGEEHTLYLMLDSANPHGVSTPSMSVIRKRLSEDEVTPQNLRWNSDCDCVQQTPDAGTTWVDTPTADPRHGSGFQLPPRGGTDPRCDAAANMLDKLKKMVNVFEQDLSQLQAANALVDVILVFLPEVGIIIEACLAITEFLLTIGSAAISAAFTDDQWDIIFCILYCNTLSDGTVNATGLTSIWADIHAQCTSVVYDVLCAPVLGVMNSIDEVGLTNAGATGDATGDCSSCPDSDFCHVWGIGYTSLDEWTATFSGGAGTFSAGIWHGVSGDGGTAVVIRVGAGVPITIDTVTMVYSNNDNGGERPDCLLFLAGTQVARIDSTNSIHSVQSSATEVFSFGGVVCDTIELVNTSASEGILCTVEQAKLEGNGACGIFGADNC